MVAFDARASRFGREPSPPGSTESYAICAPAFANIGWGGSRLVTAVFS
jgi:hypothetical protein